MKLRKGIIQVIIANFINLIISIGNGFLLPKYLSVESYANLKTFLLYISYVGILHFGYIDGIYIKYGGKTISEITQELIKEKKILFIFQTGITLPIILIALFLDDVNLLLAAISVLPINMVSLYKFVYQATGEFREYRYITNLSTGLIFILNLMMLFIVKTDISLCFILIQVIVSFIVWFFYESKNRRINNNNGISIGEIKGRINENVRLGIVIMLGNFMGIWIASIDRWFVKIFYSVSEFAYYSFAVTMLRLINVVVTAFSVTLYNFFCKTTQKEDVDRLRKAVLVVGAVIITAIFPLDFIIRTYLDKYIDAIPIIRTLFATQFILIAVNAIYLNLYKALNLQKKYFMQMMIITITAFLTNTVIGYLWKENIIAYAIATLLTAFVWITLCQIELPMYKMQYNEWVYMLVVIVGYFVCAYFNTWLGMISYIGWILIASVLFFVGDIKQLINIRLNEK